MEKEVLKKLTLEEGGYSTRKGRGNVQGLLWKQIRANGNRGKRRFTITKAIKLLEITTPYTCRFAKSGRSGKLPWICVLSPPSLSKQVHL